MAQEQKKLRVVQIIKNDAITGVEYGTVEIPENVTDIKKIAQANHAFTKAQHVRQTKLCNRTKKK